MANLDDELREMLHAKDQAAKERRKNEEQKERDAKHAERRRRESIPRAMTVIQRELQIAARGIGDSGRSTEVKDLAHGDRLYKLTLRIEVGPGSHHAVLVYRLTEDEQEIEAHTWTHAMGELPLSNSEFAGVVNRRIDPSVSEDEVKRGVSADVKALIENLPPL